MIRLFTIFWLYLAALLSFQHSFAAQSEAVDTGKTIARLISSHDQVEPGARFYMALETRLDAHWHTYWKNPGDSGEPVQIRWELPNGVNAGEIIWPLPTTIATGPIINYGFEGTPYFPVPFTVDENVRAGETLNISANVYYLVCYDVCIPEQATLSLQLTVGPNQDDTLSKAVIDTAMARAPKLGEVSGGLIRNGQDIAMSATGLPQSADVSDSYFFAFEQGYILSSEPQKITRGDAGITLHTKADYVWDDAPLDVLEGVLRYKKDGQFEGQIVRFDVGSVVSIGGSSTGKTAAAIPASTNGANIGFWTALLGAFIGGVILNLMPCVFPIISMKALHLTHSAHAGRGTIRRDAWLYTFGVLATFLILTVLLLFIKAAGTQIGWGFHLQSPIIVGVLALLLFVIGLNLLGCFEIGGGLQNVGGNLARSGGTKGAFFTGVLATIVATPCTAPFMAGATGYAMSQSAFITVVIFMALAFGFALPFLLLAYAPKLLQRLPKPGPWMARFKQLLSFPMFAAAIWLVWVLVQQAGDVGLITSLSAMLVFALALWAAQSPRVWLKGLAAILILISLALPLTLRTSAAGIGAEISRHDGDISAAWSPEAVSAALAEGKTVFVDFTAAWCVTCKVNERLVLSLPKVKKRLAADDVVFMVADWTNKNEAIAQELSRHGRSGVPLYLVYTPDNNHASPVILPQILSQNMVLSALN